MTLLVGGILAGIGLLTAFTVGLRLWMRPD